MPKPMILGFGMTAGHHHLSGRWSNAEDKLCILGDVTVPGTLTQTYHTRVFDVVWLFLIGITISMLEAVLGVGGVGGLGFKAAERRTLV